MIRRWTVSAQVLVAALVWGRSALAQRITGRVTDAADSSRIVGATITLTRDSSKIKVSDRTDTLGQFAVRASGPGDYVLEVKRLGYLPRTVRVSVATADVIGRVISLSKMAQSIDTVVTSAPQLSLFTLTPGREFYRRHLLLNQGQFVSGLEIQHSKLSAIEYLGTLPGLRLEPTLPLPHPFDNLPNIPPSLPGKTGYLVSAAGNHCLYGRIDRWSVIGLIDLNDVEDVDDLITAADITGVEIYQPDEIPKEWEMDGWINRLVWRKVSPVRQYLIGDTGMPRIKRETIRPDFRTPVPSLVNQMTAVEGTSPFTSVDLPSMVTPKCGFVQIWTRMAW